MKKIQFTLFLLLGGMTAAWAGEGNGTSEFPYTGKWTVSELGSMLKKGDRLAFDCKIYYGRISVFDTKLGTLAYDELHEWNVGSDASDNDLYESYCYYNHNRESQTFDIRSVEYDGYSSLRIEGSFSGSYNSFGDDYVRVGIAETLEACLRGNQFHDGNPHAKILLTHDIYLSDEFTDTFCSTFYGVLEGDGHTIYGSSDGKRENRNYLFTYADGAQFRHITFKDIRKNSNDHPNQCVIVSQAKNGCLFEDITFDNVGTWSNYDNVGACTGHATDCAFRNITVKNSDFTTDDTQSGAVVGHAERCTFTNIRVLKCESTSADGKSGGVAGRADNCTFNNVEVDDQSCICANDGYVGGIIGQAEDCQLSDCINSSIITGAGLHIGGIAGSAFQSTLTRCLNTGMVVNAPRSVSAELHKKYANKQMKYVTKYYNGKAYDIREDYENHTGFFNSCYPLGGIVGTQIRGEISYCTNFGFLNTKSGGCGGIVALLSADTNINIHDCLTDFKYCVDDETFVYGFAGAIATNLAKVANCVSTSTNELVCGDNYTTHDIAPNYVCRQNCPKPEREITVSADEMASGKLIERLGKGWEQNLGTDKTPIPSGNNGLYHTRDINHEYGTICLPFNAYSDEDIRFYTYEGFRMDESGMAIELFFNYAYRLDAGKPGLFWAKTDKITINYEGNGYVWSPYEPVIVENCWTMAGTFEQKVFEGDAARSIYYVTNGEIRNARKVTIAPYRAYFHGVPVAEEDDLPGAGGYSARAIQFSLDEENGTATIRLPYDDAALRCDDENAKAYTLFGTEAGEGYRGIVVRGGLKAIVK